MIICSTYARSAPQSTISSGLTHLYPVVPQAVISPPTASGIELERVAGVHGPGTLIVVLITPG